MDWRRLTLTLLIVVCGCSSAPMSTDPNVVQALPSAEYKSLIKKYTRETNQYSGFYQTFQASATMLNSEVQTAMLRQRASFLQWDQRTYQSERDKVLQEAAAYAKFFLRFYAPDRDYDDLHKPKTIWKAYLEYGGSRFDGKIRKMTEKFSEIQNIIPYMDDFSTPYEITFNVPMTTIESAGGKLVLTSSLGSAKFDFPGSK